MNVNEDVINRTETQRPMGKPPRNGWQGAIANYFQFDFYRTNFRTEILAGITTFMTMAYILVVNPLILSDAIFINEPRDLFAELVVATAVSAGIGTLIMAVFAKYPFALAPGMGINAFFAYSVVLSLGIEWRTALACVFVEGIIFILLTVTDVRRHLITAVPTSIKSATTVGIGLFLAYIGLGGTTETGGAGLIVASEVTKTDFGSLAQPQTLMAVFGIFLTALFMVRRIKGALLWGIVGTALLGWLFGVANAPQGIASIPAFPVDLFGAAFTGLAGINGSNWIDFVAALLVFLFVDMFDTIGTLAGVGMQAGYIDENGELPRANQALTADAIATTTGAIMGTSSVTTFVESASGVAEGGRTGFTSVIVAALFFISLIFTPIFEAIPAFATTPALTIVGVLMLASITTIDWEDLTEAIPAFLTIFFIPFAFSIAAGLSVGLIAYPILKTFKGRAGDVPLVTWILAAIFIARFIFMTLRFG
ncbi:NCS2 family permease [Myxosarcina sp. GI1]|uniref:NCS2 family permease n=1 Tax=Myxosarcina sp. GI1 TaxID=1541065 RepID=UPI000561AA8E|nr:NCS2 family permease [Myxosarcina sp. GI1]